MTVGAEACKWHQKLSFVPGVPSVVSAVAGTCVAGAYSHGIVCEIHGLLSPSLWRKPVNRLMHRADKDYNRCRVVCVMRGIGIGMTFFSYICGLQRKRQEMPIIKKLDKFILRSFILLFCATFFICLFIFMMQFLWKYVDELVGKGLAMTVLAQFFFYSALTLVPSSLPLAVLLASLMTFGNFGERYELLAMKAAGIPLTRIMAPLIVFSIFLGATSFYFQNVIAPNASVKLWTLIVSMRQKSPELDIPEGVFYNEIPRRNLYVKSKDRDTGMMYGVMIYDFTNGFEDARILVSDSGKLEMTADKKYLKLTLYSGEQFENLKNQSGLSRNVPYRRESFSGKEMLIEFDSGFNMADAGFMANQSMSKNMSQLSSDIDSMTVRSDSIGRSYYAESIDKLQYYKASHVDSDDEAYYSTARTNVDSIYDNASLSDKRKYLDGAKRTVSSTLNDWKFRNYTLDENDYQVRKHWTEWYRKITLSLACIIFFFIGSPLGAIIRKGGLGMPVVVSVVIFIFYYIIDNTAYKMARDGNWDVTFGMLLSTVVLSGLGAFLTYKANKDSTVLNADAYRTFMHKLLLIPAVRHYARKDVIIDTPDAADVRERLGRLSAMTRDYLATHKLRHLPSYVGLFAGAGRDDSLRELSEVLEHLCETLSNSRSLTVLSLASGLPVLATTAHLGPFADRRLNIAAAIILPVGLWFYVRSLIFRNRLYRDLNKIADICKNLDREITDGKL